MVCIGFDIGGTKCAVSVGELQDGKVHILGREEVPTGESAIETLDRLAPAIERFRDEYSVTKAGISCGGPLNSSTGVIIAPPNLKPTRCRNVIFRCTIAFAQCWKKSSSNMQVYIAHTQCARVDY